MMIRTLPRTSQLISLQCLFNDVQHTQRLELMVQLQPLVASHWDCCLAVQISLSMWLRHTLLSTLQSNTLLGTLTSRMEIRQVLLAQLAATIYASLHHTTADPHATISVALLFAGAWGLTKGMSTTCLQQPPEATVSLPFALASPQPCPKGPVLPCHDSINPWAQATGKSHTNGTSLQNCQESLSQCNFN